MARVRDVQQKYSVLMCAHPYISAQPWGGTFHLHMLREDMLRGVLRSRCRPAILQVGYRLAANVEGSRRLNVGEGAAI